MIEIDSAIRERVESAKRQLHDEGFQVNSREEFAEQLYLRATSGFYVSKNYYFKIAFYCLAEAKVITGYEFEEVE